jgi:acyl dehydratase
MSRGRVPAGAVPPPRTIGPLTQTDVVRFAGAGGDFNPLHHDPEVAAQAGFDRPIAMGQLTAGLAAAWLTDWCGVEHLRALRVRFVAPLLIGDVVVLSASLATDQSDRAGLSHLDLVASVGERPVLLGWCTIAST